MSNSKTTGRILFFFVSPAVLAFGVSACVSTKAADHTVPIESKASEVKQGMSPEKVGRILGEFSHESFEASSSSFSCRSYPYGEAPNSRFVIVFFDYESTGKPSAESATDGHIEPCELPGDVL